MSSEAVPGTGVSGWLSTRRDWLAYAVLTGLAAAMTWPLLSPWRVFIPASDDAYFSIWRLAWVAHQLRADPMHLFDANVFHPAAGALAYSDAMLLLGVTASPFLWAGADAAIVHNLLLVLAIASSAWGAYLLARRLTGDRAASFLAAVVFGFAPYRFGHIGHLELQWVVWMPLSLLLLHSLFDRPRGSAALGLGAAVAAQTLCSIYYGLFLSVYLMVAWCGLLVFSAYRRRTAVVSLLALVPILVIVGAYSIPYAHNRSTQGPRSAAEVERYSAVPADFLRVPPENRLRGEHNGDPAPDERSLFPGAIAIALAITALWPPVSRTAGLYAVLAVVAFDASLGTNGFSFSVLQWLAPPLTSLRAPARFAALFLLSLALLAALAAARWNKSSGGRATAWTLVAAVLCVGEYWSGPLPVRPFETKPSAAHQWLALQPADTVVLELPMPTPATLWLYETTFQVRSIHHWKRLVNGYSSFIPADYGRTITLMPSFPDALSVNRLRALSVDVVLLNRGLFTEPAYHQLTSALRNSPDFLPPMIFGAGSGEVLAFRLGGTAEP